MKTEIRALEIVAEMVLRFSELHILNISQSDWTHLRTVREELERIIHENGYRLNYDKNLKCNLIKR